MELSVVQTRIDDGIRRMVTLSGVSDGTRHTTYGVYYDLLGETKCPKPEVWDGFVAGIICYAMRTGQDVHVKGPLSRRFVRNINEFQMAWSRWKPKTYKRVAITAKSVIEDAKLQKPERAISAFSGGVDSVFTLLRHAKQLLGEASYPLNKSVLLVHGFDVPLNKPEHLALLRDRIKPLTDKLGLTIKVVRTNSKELNLQDWEDSFSSQLSGCLHQYAHDYSYGLIGSSEPYDGLVLPWGSNPITDAMLTGGRLDIVHDGCGYSRTEKVEEIAKDTLATRILKVCWQGQNSFENCGMCEKCLRTRLNFLAVGAREPGCFKGAMNEKWIRQITPANTAQDTELLSILAYAAQRNIKAGWLKKLRSRVGKRPSLLAKRLKTLGGLLCKGQYAEVIGKTLVHIRKR